MGLFNDKGELGILQKKCQELKKETATENKKLIQISKNYSKNKTLEKNQNFSEDIERSRLLYQKINDLKTESESMNEDTTIRNFAKKLQTEKEKLTIMQMELGTNIKYISDISTEINPQIEDKSSNQMDTQNREQNSAKKVDNLQQNKENKIQSPELTLTMEDQQSQKDKNLDLAGEKNSDRGDEFPLKESEEQKVTENISHLEKIEKDKRINDEITKEGISFEDEDEIESVVESTPKSNFAKENEFLTKETKNLPKIETEIKNEIIDENKSSKEIEKKGNEALNKTTESEQFGGNEPPLGSKENQSIGNEELKESKEDQGAENKVSPESKEDQSGTIEASLGLKEDQKVGNEINKESKNDEKSGNLNLSEANEMKESKPRDERYVVLQDWQGEDVDDLDVTKGDVLTIVDTQDHPWWYMKNNDGEEGVVPSNLLKIVQVEMHQNEQDGEKNSQIEQKKKDAQLNEEIHMHRTESYGQVGPEYVENIILSSIKNDKMNEKLTLINTLQAANRIPDYCHISHFELLETDDKHSASYALYPHLGKSSIKFLDLAYNEQKEKILSNKSKITVQRIMSIKKVRNINIDVSPDIKIISRHIRFALHSENKFGNVMACESAKQTQDLTTWLFIKKAVGMSCRTNPVIFINSTAENILFEVCATISSPDFGEVEISCGWARLPLLKDKNTSVPNGHHVIQLQGGFLLQKGIVIPTNKQKRRSTLLGARLGPTAQIVVRLSSPRARYANKLSCLPVNFIGSSLWIDLLEKYREIQLNELVVKTSFTEEPNDGFLNVFLTVIPALFDQHDIWDTFTKIYEERVKGIQRADLMGELKYLVLRFVYPMLCIQQMPKYGFGNMADLKKRENIIRAFETVYRGMGTCGSVFLCEIPNYNYKPFDIHELSYDLLQHYTH